MEPFDKRLKERAKQEPFPLPETYAGKVRNTCAALKETTMKDTKQKRSCRALLGVAAALAVFVAIPNVSPSAAAAMSDIPVLGAVVRVVTFRDYQYDDGHNTADVHVSELGGSDAADEVNDQVQAFTDQLIAQFQADCEATGEGYQGLDITSSVVTDSDTWFTLRIDATKVKASGYDLTRFYHLDTAPGEIVTLSDLFRPGADYVSVLSAEVLRQMEEQMAADASLSYLTDEFTAIDPEQSFYWNADGDLVLVFDEYTVAAGYMGMVEFTIPRDVYSALLKECSSLPAEKQRAASAVRCFFRFTGTAPSARRWRRSGPGSGCCRA